MPQVLLAVNKEMSKSLLLRSLNQNYGNVLFMTKKALHDKGNSRDTHRIGREEHRP